jgi:Flp pilus assembly protein TadD
MCRKPWCSARWIVKASVIVGSIAIGWGWAARAHAGDIRITLPRATHLTPVQQLNRNGVEEVRKHNYQKAEALFYKAYLLDPDDPFTLNNLGYISELEGQVDRAQSFYRLAKQQPTEAVIDQASSKQLQGRSIAEALAVKPGPLEIDHDNVEAVRLLSQRRAAEADLLLETALKIDPENVFTLNNLGVAREIEGESQQALKYYDEAAATGSKAAAVVTLDRSWRGKLATAMAAQNAKRLRNRIEKQPSPELQVAEFNLRGVYAVNRNDLSAANQDFRSAYALDPDNAFALNNIGYLAEMEGDPETAQFFYDRARDVAGKDTTVGLASRRSAEGLRLSQVASDSDNKVESLVDREREAYRRQQPPVVLYHRDNTPVEEAPPDSIPPPQSPVRPQ